jgi:hypothetical protein
MVLMTLIHHQLFGCMLGMLFNLCLLVGLLFLLEALLAPSLWQLGTVALQLATGVSTCKADRQLIHFLQRFKSAFGNNLGVLGLYVFLNYYYMVCLLAKSYGEQVMLYEL